MKEIIDLLPALGVAIVLNIACGTWYNLKIDNIDFDWVKLLDGIKKAIIIALSFIGLAYIVSKVPQVTDALGVAPKGVITLAIIGYTVKFVTQLTKILGVNLNTKKTS